MSGNGDHLLYVLSARRDVSWQAFKAAFDVLYLRWSAMAGEAREPVQFVRWRAVRMLDGLGHCDIAFGEGGGRLYVAPPVLARLPVTGLPRAVLCGARSPDVSAGMRDACRTLRRTVRVSVQEQERYDPFAPQRVAAEADSTGLLAALAEKLKVDFVPDPPAWSLLQFAGSLQEYLQSCEWCPRQEMNWQRYDFDVTSLRFRDGPSRAPGTRLSRYDDPVRHRRTHYLWRGESSAEIDLDWGRYAVLQAKNQQVLVYDPTNLIFAVPSSAPLPRLLARVLTLCSGYTPQYVRGPWPARGSPEWHGFDAFSEVPPDIARLTAAKLGQILLEAPVNGTGRVKL